MRKLILNRVYYEDSTFGILCAEDHPLCVTLERPWFDNEKGLSCIPEGDYTCIKYNSDRFRNTYQVEDVPGRSKILFHKGNYVSDSTGCILLGQYFTMTENENPMVAQSRKAMTIFRRYLGEDKAFRLRIMGFRDTQWPSW